MTIADRPDAAPSSPPAPEPVVVVGIGNDARGDDGVGPRVIALLQDRVRGHVRLVAVGDDPLAVLDAWPGADLVILVDAMCTGAPPGRVERFEPSTMPGSHLALHDTLASSHGVGLAETLELARALDRLPERLVLYGIEAASFEFGAPLSEPVAAAAAAVADRIAATLTAP